MERVVFGRLGRVGHIAQEHEGVPDAELRREGNGVVEEREVPARAPGRGGDAEFFLFDCTRLSDEILLQQR